MEKYGLHSKFDFKKHKETFINYLEVLILENGEIVYAVPSHQMKAEELAYEKLNVDRPTLIKLCPKEYHFDYLKWLLTITNSISVWDDFYIYGFNGINDKQMNTLKKLKLYGLYRGIIDESGCV